MSYNNRDYGTKHTATRSRNHHQRPSDYTRTFKHSKVDKHDDGDRDVFKKGGELKITISNEDKKPPVLSSHNSNSNFLHRTSSTRNGDRPINSSSRNGQLPSTDTRKRFRRSRSREQVHRTHEVTKLHHYKYEEYKPHHESHRNDGNKNHRDRNIVNKHHPGSNEVNKNHHNSRSHDAFPRMRNHHKLQKKLPPEPKPHSSRKYSDVAKPHPTRDRHRPERRNIYTSDSPPHNKRPSSFSEKQYKSSEKVSHSRYSDSTRRKQQPPSRSSPKRSHYSPRQHSRRYSKNNSSSSNSSAKRHGNSKRQEHAAPSAVSFTDSSSSEDEKALRMRLLKDKYCTNNDQDDIQFLGKRRTDELDDEVFRHDEKNSSHSPPTSPRLEYVKDESKIDANENNSMCDVSQSEEYSDDQQDADGKAFHFASDVSADSSKTSSPTTSPNVAVTSDVYPDVIPNSERYSPSPPQNMIMPEKQRKRRKKKSSSSSSDSTTNSSSSNSSSSSSSLNGQTVTKRSRWSSGSASPEESKAIPKPPKPHRISSPLANKSVLKSITPACVESMFRLRNCKFCALNLRTMDDVKRHVASERHRVVTGEYFFNNLHLLRAPQQGELVRCVICNAIIEFNRSIKEHEHSNQHRQLVRRWMSRTQPKPPVKYYIDS